MLGLIEVYDGKYLFGLPIQKKKGKKLGSVVESV